MVRVSLLIPVLSHWRQSFLSMAPLKLFENIHMDVSVDPNHSSSLFIWRSWTRHFWYVVVHRVPPANTISVMFRATHLVLRMLYFPGFSKQQGRVLTHPHCPLSSIYEIVLPLDDWHDSPLGQLPSHPSSTLPLAQPLTQISFWHLFLQQELFQMSSRTIPVWHQAKISSQTSRNPDVLHQSCNSPGPSSDSHCIDISPSISQYGVEESFSRGDKLLLPHHNSGPSPRRRCWKWTPSRKFVLIMLGIMISLCLGIMWVRLYPYLE